MHFYRLSFYNRQANAPAGKTMVKQITPTNCFNGHKKRAASGSPYMQ